MHIIVNLNKIGIFRRNEPLVAARRLPRMTGNNACRSNVLKLHFMLLADLDGTPFVRSHFCSLAHASDCQVPQLCAISGHFGNGNVSD
jgi:hypothetical protein